MRRAQGVRLTVQGLRVRGKEWSKGEAIKRPLGSFFPYTVFLAP
jgi:hypothetical protein